MSDSAKINSRPENEDEIEDEDEDVTEERNDIADYMRLGGSADDLGQRVVAVEGIRKVYTTNVARKKKGGGICSKPEKGKFSNLNKQNSELICGFCV